MTIISLLIIFQVLVLVVFFLKSEKQRKNFLANQLNKKQVILKDIDVVIAAKENYETICNCVSSVYECGFSNVFLCIDGGGDSKNNLNLKFPKANIICNSQTLGKIRSQIKCLKKSLNSNILVLDADVTLNKEKITDFVNYFKSNKVDFLCPYSTGNLDNMDSIFGGIIESDRYMRQRIIRAGRDAFGISNLSGYCMLVKKNKYLSIIDSNAVQDDVIATINLFKRNYIVKTYHSSICCEVERKSVLSYLFQKTRWTAGNLSLLNSYITMFNEIDLKRSLAFFSSFLLWYFALWIDFIGFILAFFYPVIWILLSVESVIKFTFLIKVSDFKNFIGANLIYVVVWPFFITCCLILTPFYLCGYISESCTRR